MPFVVIENCIKCKYTDCVEVCPVECIIPGQPESEWPWYFIDPDTCIDCGACVPECPFEAIFPEEDVPVQLKSFIGKNREVFVGPTPPGRPTR